MNGKLAKYTRKQVKKKIKRDLEDMARVLGEERFYWRFVYAIRILFNWHPEPIMFEVKQKDE